MLVKIKGEKEMLFYAVHKPNQKKNGVFKLGTTAQTATAKKRLYTLKYTEGLKFITGLYIDNSIDNAFLLLIESAARYELAKAMNIARFGLDHFQYNPKEYKATEIANKAIEIAIKVCERYSIPYKVVKWEEV